MLYLDIIGRLYISYIRYTLYSYYIYIYNLILYKKKQSGCLSHSVNKAQRNINRPVETLKVVQSLGELERHE